MTAIPADKKAVAIEQILEAIPSAPPTLGLRKICEDAGVKAPTFLLWVDQDKDLAERYARAMAFRVEAAELVNLAESCRRLEVAMRIEANAGTEYAA